MNRSNVVSFRCRFSITGCDTGLKVTTAWRTKERCALQARPAGKQLSLTAVKEESVLRSYLSAPLDGDRTDFVCETVQKECVGAHGRCIHIMYMRGHFPLEHGRCWGKTARGEPFLCRN